MKKGSIFPAVKNIYYTGQNKKNYAIKPGSRKTIQCCPSFNRALSLNISGRIDEQDQLNCSQLLA